MLWREDRLFVFPSLSLSLRLSILVGLLARARARRRRSALLITYENGARHLYSDNDRPTDRPNERTDQVRRDELTASRLGSSYFCVRFPFRLQILTL